jgi:hypothetical protein
MRRLLRGVRGNKIRHVMHRKAFVILRNGEKSHIFTHGPDLKKNVMARWGVPVIYQESS